MANAVEITLEFVGSVPCSVGALSDEAVNLLVDALAGVLTVVLTVVLIGCL